MATQVQLRRGTTAQNDGFTGAEGEVTVDTDVETLRVHNGITIGGFTLVNLTGSQTLTNKTLTAPAITSPTVTGAGSISITGNVTGGNLTTAGLINATGNITGGNLTTGAEVVATGNITGGNLITGAQVVATGNITGGNLITGAQVVATGNITGGNLTTGAEVVATGNITGGNLITGAQVVATGNVTGGNLITGAQVVATGNVTGGNLRSAGTLTVNSGGAATAIVNGAANAVGNIGSSSTYFNTLFAKATSAQYADLAEMYTADQDYDAGTVLSFGGSAEVTKSDMAEDTRIAGVVSTSPSYLMNATQEGDYVVPVALMGKVPTRVTGSVRKGDMMVSNGDGTACAKTDPKMGSVIGKALADFDGAVGVIDVVVGRL